MVHRIHSSLIVTEPHLLREDCDTTRGCGQYGEFQVYATVTTNCEVLRSPMTGTNQVGRPMSVVTVQSEIDPSSKRDVLPGELVIFGECACGACEIDVVANGISGHLNTADSVWTLTNHSERVPIQVWNLERPAEHMVVQPRRANVPVPFEIACVGGSVGHTMTVYGHAPDVSRCREACADTTEARGMNRTAKYFPVLVALCEPRLLGDHVSAPPRSGAIASRLGMKQRNVDACIGYLMDKLDVQPRTRTTLVAHAILRGYVTPPDAEILP